MWGEPDHGTRRLIGQLWRDSSGFAFAYGHEVEKAIAQGFRLLAEFPELRTFDSPYVSGYLFATFSQRIPSPRRADFEHIMTSWGLTAIDHPLDVLARSGGVQMTDRIELAEYRPDDDELEAPLLFRLAGMKHHPGSADIRAGAELSLLREPENAFDNQAVAVLAPGREKAGYVPRQYSSLVARLLDGGVFLEALAVRQLGVPADEGRWVIRLVRQ